MTKDEKLAELAETVTKMRAAQKLYFKNRTPEALAASKHLERAVDKALAELETPDLF